jgi:hypothetical protein
LPFCPVQTLQWIDASIFAYEQFVTHMEAQVNPAGSSYIENNHQRDQQLLDNNLINANLAMNLIGTANNVAQLQQIVPVLPNGEPLRPLVAHGDVCSFVC